jgi:hypothetical protein
MTITSQQYAGLADDAYKDYPVGVFPPGREPRFEYEGVEYKILEHVNNRRTGYQGTIYQRADTGEIVVAHRGTEFDKLRSDPVEVVRDLLQADGGMVLNRTNLQANDAIALTERAKSYAEQSADYFGGRTPEVTVTGHSLGGILAQISAYRCGVRGETFNPYGAVSLVGHRTPEGGDRVVNHVMATDFVSAASPHYGQVRVYAAPMEINRLHAAGYYDNPVIDAVTPNLTLPLAVTSIGSHYMDNFLDVDGKRSVLGDPAAQRLYEQHARIIDSYREDVGGLRSKITLGFGNPLQNINRGVEQLEDALERSLRRQYQHAPPPGGVPNVQPHQLPSGFPMPSFRAGGFGAIDDARRPGQAMPALGDDPIAFVDRMLAAAKSGDDATFRQLTQAAADSQAGRELRAEAVATVDRQEELARLQLAEQRAREPQAQTMGHQHVMHMG